MSVCTNCQEVLPVGYLQNLVEYLNRELKAGTSRVHASDHGKATSSIGTMD